MKNNLIFLFSLLILFVTSCKTRHMQELKMDILLNERLPEDKADDLKIRLLGLMEPIEIGDTVFIPKVTLVRQDMSSTFTWDVPMESANKLRKAAGTYNYDNYLDDFSEFEKGPQLPSYITEASNGQQKMYTDNNSLIYKITSTPDTIIRNNIIEMCKKEGGRKRVVLYYISLDKSPAKLDLNPDSSNIFVSKDNRKIISKPNPKKPGEKEALPLNIELIFNENNGTLEPKVDRSGNFKYYLMVSKNQSFEQDDLYPTISLNKNNPIFPTESPEYKSYIDNMKHFTGLYFKLIVVENEKDYRSKNVGPYKIRCTNSGDCKLMPN